MPAHLRTGIPKRWSRALALAIIPLAVTQPDRAIAEVVIQLVTTDQPYVEVTGVPAASLKRLKEQPADRAAWQRVLSLYVESETARSVSPVLGDYAVRHDRLVFTPRFPLKPALKYRAVFDPAGLPGKPSPARRRIEAIVFLPALPRAEPTTVDAVFPTSDVLPENQLKFYIHFSAPMSRGDSYRHIRLLDAQAKPVEAPFLELAEELWDESGLRFTLLLDPGRVKHDLKPNKEVGRALAAGHAYTLLIDDDWRDARGAPLGRELRKRFQVTNADVRQPDPLRWQLTVPRSGTRDPLVVDFDEPLDHAMVQHVIRVSDPEKGVRDGNISIDQQETQWTFQPTAPWLAGSHRLIVDATLEDLAGNSIERPFEVFLPSAQPTNVDRRFIEFEVHER